MHWRHPLKCTNNPNTSSPHTIRIHPTWQHMYVHVCTHLIIFLMPPPKPHPHTPLIHSQRHWILDGPQLVWCYTVVVPLLPLPLPLLSLPFPDGGGNGLYCCRVVICALEMCIIRRACVTGKAYTRRHNNQQKIVKILCCSIKDNACSLYNVGPLRYNKLVGFHSTTNTIYAFYVVHSIRYT